MQITWKIIACWIETHVVIIELRKRKTATPDGIVHQNRRDTDFYNIACTMYIVLLIIGCMPHGVKVGLLSALSTYLSLLVVIV